MTDKVLAADTSPEALLKRTVAGAEAAAQKAGAAQAVPAKAALRHSLKFDSRAAGLAGAALALGVLLGAGAMTLAGPHGDRDAAMVAQIRTHLDAGRTEADRAQAQIDRMGRTLSQVQEVAEALRSEAKTRSAALTDRIARAEQALTAKLAALAEKVDLAEKDQAARLATLATQAEKKSAQPMTAAPSSARAGMAEPSETGALPDKPKSSPTDNWALREVYDGVAVLEDRKRRLVEVGLGDTVPGVGRIEAIERRGKAWVAVTRQGVITAQTW